MALFFSFLMHFKMSSAICFNLQSKILSSGNGQQLFSRSSHLIVLFFSRTLPYIQIPVPSLSISALALLFLHNDHYHKDNDYYQSTSNCWHNYHPNINCLPSTHSIYIMFRLFGCYKNLHFGQNIQSRICFENFLLHTSIFYKNHERKKIL